MIEKKNRLAMKADLIANTTAIYSRRLDVKVRPKGERGKGKGPKRVKQQEQAKTLDIGKANRLLYRIHTQKMSCTFQYNPTARIRVVS